MYNYCRDGPTPGAQGIKIAPSQTTARARKGQPRVKTADTPPAGDCCADRGG